MSLIFPKAARIPIVDTGGHFSSDNIEGALQELGAGGGGGSIPQYSTDPVSPSAEDAWVLRTGSVSGGGELKSLFPFIVTAGTGGYTYELSYRTNEGTTIRTTLT